MMNFRVMALTLVMITTMSYATCYIDELSESKQLACDHSGDSVCTMQGDDCCLTEMGEVKSEDSGIPLCRVNLGADWTAPPEIHSL
jgi:hypothetical protein